MTSDFADRILLDGGIEYDCPQRTDAPACQRVSILSESEYYHSRTKNITSQQGLGLRLGLGLGWVGRIIQEEWGRTTRDLMCPEVGISLLATSASWLADLKLVHLRVDADGLRLKAMLIHGAGRGWAGRGGAGRGGVRGGLAGRCSKGIHSHELLFSSEAGLGLGSRGAARGGEGCRGALEIQIFAGCLLGREGAARPNLVPTHERLRRPPQ